MKPLRGFSFWEKPPPMGLCEDPSTHSQNQATEKNPWRKRRARHPRSRICLLKGCGRTFRPEHPLTRYCGEPCREQARQWWEWKARHQYRQSDGGKQKRQAQSRRYRLRRKARKKQEAATGNGARVITTNFFSCSCDRPGCYEVFQRTRRSPLQRFCSHACRRALDRVLERERRWRERQPARR
jgi:hypothetical protein